MRGIRVLLGLAGAVVLVRLAGAQQQPIFGCHSSLSCRTGPLRDNALNDRGAGSMLFGVGFAWDPGFQFRVVLPVDTSPTPTPLPGVDLQKFRLRGVRLLPEPTATPQPTPRPTPAAPVGSK